MKPDELLSLIDALVDGDLSEADFLRLEAELSVNPAARKLYYERMKLSMLLHHESQSQSQAPAKVIAFPQSNAWRRHSGWLAAAAAVVFLAIGGAGGWFAAKPDSVGIVESGEPFASGYGVVSGQSGATWKNRGPLERGDLVPLGGLELAAGTVQLDLFSGVTVVVEGEAAFEVLSSMEMAVTRGKIQAHVPEPAQGFRLRTTNGELVDLGTEFAIEVTPDHADIRVIEGEIEWHPKSQPMRNVTGGNAIRHSSEGLTSPLPFDAARAGRIGDLEARLAAQRAERRETWLSRSKALAADPRLALYFPMSQQGPWSRQLDDLSEGGHNGAIVAAQRVNDRWGATAGALDFSPTGSRVRVNLPGDFGSLTLLCWVKINSLDRLYNSLFLTDGHDQGEPHWQIMNDGRLFFSVKKQESVAGRPDKHIFYSPAIWNPSQSGQWAMIATVYDVTGETVTHYLNGEPISSETIPAEYLVEKVNIGAASIGNWSEPAYRKDPEFAVRNLNGAIDEFALFSAALTPEEVQNLYEIGKP